jgi:hypothetical protein
LSACRNACDYTCFCGKWPEGCPGGDSECMPSSLYTHDACPSDQGCADALMCDDSVRSSKRLGAGGAGGPVVGLWYARRIFSLMEAVGRCVMQGYQGSVEQKCGEQHSEADDQFIGSASFTGYVLGLF